MLQAGFTKSQAVALTAEVGRENDYRPQYLFGYHIDASNKAKNIGMISWQGFRAVQVEMSIKAKGVIHNGIMEKTQKALDAQADFIEWEIENNKAYIKTKEFFKANPNADPELYAPILGKDYIKWAYGQTKLRSGMAFDWKKHDAKRRMYKEQALKKVQNL